MKKRKSKWHKGVKGKSSISMVKTNRATGITLVALVITIVILIILATITVKFAFGENGLIGKAESTVLMTEFTTYKEEMNVFSTTKKLENLDYSNESLNAGSTSLSYNTKEGTDGNIQTVIPSMKGEYLDKFEIIKGELLLNTTDGEELKIAMALGIEVNPYEIIDGVLTSSNTNLGLQTSNGTITIPDSVREIGAGAFSNVKGLKTVIIPGTVKKIGTNAFTNNSELEKVILEEGVEVIGQATFKQCTGIKSIELPESLVTIEKEAFAWCTNLTNVKIPSKVITIDELTFLNCVRLTDIELPENLQEIKGGAFTSCQISYIYIPKNVNKISNSSFSSCNKLEIIEIADENTNFNYESGMLVDVNENNILFISKKIIENSNTFSIPEGITYFNTNMENFNNITTIVIPKSLELIGDAGILPLTISSIMVTEGNTHFVVEDYCLYNADKTDFIMCFSKNATVNIAQTVANIHSYAFRLAPNIENVTFANNITKLGSQVFNANNNKLQNIHIGASVTHIDPLFKYGNYYGTVTMDEANLNYSIENNELYNKDKTQLLSVWHDIQGSYTVKNGVTKIGDRAFHNKTQMTEVILPEGLKEIGQSFNYCTSLTEIFIPNSVEKIGSEAFNNSSNLQLIKIDKEPNTIDGAPWGAIGWDRAVQWLR